MSEAVLFAIGVVVFAITVYGSVMAGGVLLTRESELEGAVPSPGDNVDEPHAVERPRR